MCLECSPGERATLKKFLARMKEELENAMKNSSQFCSDETDALLDGFPTNTLTRAENNNRFVFLIHVDGVPIGFLDLYRGEPALFYIAPEYRGTYCVPSAASQVFEWMLQLWHNIAYVMDRDEVKIRIDAYTVTAAGWWKNMGVRYNVRTLVQDDCNWLTSVEYTIPRPATAPPIPKIECAVVRRCVDHAKADMKCIMTDHVETQAYLISKELEETPRLWTPKDAYYRRKNKRPLAAQDPPPPAKRPRRSLPIPVFPDAFGKACKTTQC
jgi:hypothetical protein